MVPAEKVLCFYVQDKQDHLTYHPVFSERSSVHNCDMRGAALRHLG